MFIMQKALFYKAYDKITLFLLFSDLAIYNLEYLCLMLERFVHRTDFNMLAFGKLQCDKQSRYLL